MASLSKSQTGHYTVQFSDKHGARKTVRLGKIPKRTADDIRTRVTSIVSARKTNTELSEIALKWLSEVGDQLHEKLVRVGLVDARSDKTLGGYIDRYTARQLASPVIKTSTVNASAPHFKSLRAFFGDSRRLQSITRGDAKRWRESITEGHARNTVRKYTASAKKLFTAAIDDEIIASNPFGRLKSTMVKTRKRHYFITHSEAAAVLAHCPTLEWRLIFALARYGGLRCPSEILRLRWGDILWDKGKFIVRATKTEHHVGGGVRVVPIFPELEPLFSEAFHLAPSGTEYVIGLTRDPKKNFRKPLCQIIERAGLKPWPKPFQNLRSTRETELEAEFGLKLATAWIGNSERVAKDSYLQTTDEEYERGANWESAAKSAVAHPDTQSQQDASSNVAPENVGACYSVHPVDTCTVGDTGFEPVTSAV